MTEKISESCEQFRQQNGNANYSNKDLLIYLLTKTEKIEVKIGNVEKEVVSHVTYCKTIIDAKKGFKENIFQIITFIIAIVAAIGVFLF